MIWEVTSKGNGAWWVEADNINEACEKYLKSCESDDGDISAEEHKEWLDICVPNAAKLIYDRKIL